MAESDPGATPYGGHAGLANSVACDGATLVTAGAAGTARIWDARTGQQQHHLTGHNPRGELGGLRPDGHGRLGPRRAHLVLNRGAPDLQGASRLAAVHVGMRR